MHKASVNLRSILGVLLFFSLISIYFCLSNFLTGFAQEIVKEAYFYQKLEDLVVQCQLCPRRCIIPSGKRGLCQVRENRDGKLVSLVYAQPCSLHIDPIEKKPLFHVLPASLSFSIATVGCNLKCLFCQNWTISQATPGEVRSVYREPEQIVKSAREAGCLSIAYTYTEPTIFYEYMLDVAKLAKAQGIRNVMHSNGYINEEPLRELSKYLDAANIDLKGFSQEYYTEMTMGNLDPVLNALKILKEEGVWVEITNLILPGLNDDAKTITKMCLWIKENLGADVPVHFSRFHPMYKMITLSPTPVASLEKAKRIALDCGLKYVYIGNVPGHPGENTYCPNCGKVVIVRRGYTILGVNLDEQGNCKYCTEKISGIWQ